VSTVEPNSDAKRQLASYAACIFERDDIVNLRFIHHGTDHVPNFFSSAGDLSGQRANLCADHNRRGYSIYIGANPRKRTGGTKGEDVALARCLFAEWDGVSVDDARRRWQAIGLPKPTLLLFSGAGPHAYWRLTVPITDLNAWSNLQKRLLTALGSDNIHDAPRVMRLPGFINQKPDRGQTVELLDCAPDRRYCLADLAAALPELNRDDGFTDSEELPDIQKWEFEESGKKTGLRPGEDFDQRGDVGEVLRRNGWSLVRTKSDATQHWRRPGKSYGVSASLLGKAFYCFTTSTKIPAEKGHSPFAVLAYLEHDGDFSAAAKALAKAGWGNSATSNAQSASHKSNGKVKGSDSGQLATPIIVNLSTVTPEPVRWLWPGRIALGKLTILCGEPGLGKSFTTLDITSKLVPLLRLLDELLAASGNPLSTDARPPLERLGGTGGQAGSLARSILSRG
jgi:hypothetical protein